MSSHSELKERTKINRSLAKMAQRSSEWYGIRSLLGFSNWAWFYAILGARESGKSYAVMEFFVHEFKTKGIQFTWLRLNEASMKKMLSNNAEKLVDADIARRYGLNLKVKGNSVFDVREDGSEILMCKVLALSTFANDKGVALFDKDFLKSLTSEGYRNWYHICLDEFQLEKTQRSQGDIRYQFIQQMENLLRSTKERMRIFLIGNTLEEASDILTMFNFIPEKFGRYKLKSKRAVIDYLPLTEKYKERRKGTVGDILAGNASNYTNQIDFDRKLITKQRLIKPTAIIAFDKQTKFTVWDGEVINRWNGEKIKNVIAMRPYQDALFDQKLRDQIILMFDNRAFKYHNLITNKTFQQELKELKPRKQ